MHRAKGKLTRDGKKSKRTWNEDIIKQFKKKDLIHQIIYQLLLQSSFNEKEVYEVKENNHRSIISHFKHEHHDTLCCVCFTKSQSVNCGTTTRQLISIAKVFDQQS